MPLLSSTELQECGHPMNFCHECEGDLNTCGFNGLDHGGGKMITVVMGERDWAKVVLGMRYLGDFSATALDVHPEDFTFIGDSIQDVVDAS